MDKRVSYGVMRPGFNTLVGRCSCVGFGVGDCGGVFGRVLEGVIVPEYFTPFVTLFIEI